MERMIRRMIRLTGWLLLAALLSGCTAPAQTKPQPPETTASPTIQAEVPAQTEAVLPEASTAARETEPAPIPVETPYGTLYHQARWEGMLRTEQTMTDDVLCVTFFAELEGGSYRLFSVTIGGAEANAGTLCDGEGTCRNVFAVMEEPGDLSGLSDDQKDTLYALQEEINFVLDKLT